MEKIRTQIKESKYIAKILDDSGILKIYDKSTLYSIAITKYLPIILEEMKMSDSKYTQLLDVIDRQQQRDDLLFLRKEEHSRIFFFQNFLQNFNRIKQFSKRDVLRIIVLYIEISKTYDDFDKITKSLESMKKVIDTRDMDLDELHNYIITSITRWEDKYTTENIKAR